MNRPYFSILLCGLTFACNLSAAEIKTEVIAYHDGDILLEGFLAYPADLEHQPPGILVVHEWWGHNEYARDRARQLAAAGYVAFALDMYGKGILVDTYEEAGKLAGQLKGNRALMRERVKAGLEVLKNHSASNPDQLAAIGYCFGGTTVLELARSGADVKGVVSFHGNLATPNPHDAKNIKGAVLACHGGEDPYVKPEEVAAFKQEMRDAEVDWQFISYGGAVHSFTNEEAGNDPSKGAAYNEKADQRSWVAMLGFFKEIFKR